MAKPRDPVGSGPRRLVGVDLGARRIGIAIGDLDARVAIPLGIVNRGKTAAEDAATLSRIAAEHEACALVVGLPLDMDGSEGLQAIKTREWGEAVAAASGLPVRYHDERLTTVRAERRIGTPARGRSGGPPSPAQRKAHRARLDREAAALILQDDLDAMTDEGGERRST
jgi:putative Holliday junction resolvase